MTGKRFDEASSWVPSRDDLARCARCGQPWDQHEATTVQRCPRIIEVSPEFRGGKLVLNRWQWQAFENAGHDMSGYVLNEPLSGLAGNNRNDDHALNCPCELCKADPVRQAQLADMIRSQKGHTGE